MLVLGIESSCDETAAAVVRNGQEMLSSCIATSIDLHIPYGGVVPEIAARSHIEAIIPVIKQALSDADVTWKDLDAIAVTYGAGLGGSLLIGTTTARTLAIVHNKPLYGINHVEGHIYANFITSTPLSGYRLPVHVPEFPFLAIIVSGNHSQLVLFQDHFHYTLLGQTHDDAIGEAFDKVAKILGLPYPGGPNIAKKAAEGDPYRYQLPKARLGKSSYDFSFSGLKTAVLRLAQKEIGADFTFPSFKLQDALADRQKADIAASFQRVAIETIVDKAQTAFEEYHPKMVVVGGGVAASSELRKQLADRMAVDIRYPDIKLCTDNGAMIAALGGYKALLRQPTSDPYTLEIEPTLTM